MAEKNPFTVIGFAPNAFQHLSDEDIRNLVNAQYRALANLHHPDRHGNAERFKEVQSAFERLKEDFEFDFWKKMFLRKRKDQLVELEKAHRKTCAEVAELHQGLVDFWVAYCRGTETFQRPAFLTEVSDADSMEMGGFSVFNPPPVSILMMDSLADLLRKQAAQERRKANAVIQAPIESDPGCFEFCISSTGVMTRQDLVKTYFDAREKWRPPVRQAWIELRPSNPSKSYYWKPAGSPTTVSGCLIGSFPTKILSENQVRKNPEIAGLIPTEVTYDDFKLLEHVYDLNEFEPYLRYIRPRLMSGHLVVTADNTNKRNGFRFKILGYARTILKPVKTSRRDA